MAGQGLALPSNVFQLFAYPYWPLHKELPPMPSGKTVVPPRATLPNPKPQGFGEPPVVVNISGTITSKRLEPPSASSRVG
jgi:hypothetical protein